MKAFILALAITLPILLQAAATSECERWFFANEIEPGADDCTERCASSAVGMDTFSCPAECKELCSTYLPRYIIDELTFSYALKEIEKSLIAKHPKDALSVFMAKREAIESTKRIFHRNGHNDESDAFRHFMWSGLTNGKTGEQMARLFLDAHEQDPEQPVAERKMDTHNNDRGIEESKRLQNRKRFSLEALEKAGLHSLQEGSLKVLNPKGKVPEWR